MISNSKRSEIEIIYKILNSCKREVGITQIAYNSNLCYPHFKNYFSFLMEKGMFDKNKNIKKNGKYSKEFFILSRKGERLLGNIQNVMNDLEI